MLLAKIVQFFSVEYKFLLYNLRLREAPLKALHLWNADQSGRGDCSQILQEDVLNDVSFLKTTLRGLRRQCFKWENCPLRFVSLKNDLGSFVKNGLKEVGDGHTEVLSFAMVQVLEVIYWSSWSRDSVYINKSCYGI